MLRYLQTLCERFGEGWNRFWFLPSDPLPLAVLRVLIGMVAFYTVLTYGFDLERWFGPDGMLPIEMIQSLQNTPWRVSFLNLSHTRAELWTAHALSLVVLGLFTVGVYTRVTSVLALVVVLSYIHRASVLTSQFEPVLVFVMLYLCIGPAGAYLSVDHWWQGKRGTPSAERPAASYSATISLRLIQVHLAVVYAMMAHGQMSGVAWWNGEAAWWLIVNTDHALFDMTWLRTHTYLVSGWTHAIVAYELAFPVLIWNRAARPLLCMLGLFFGFSLAALTGLISFALVLVIASLAFVSGEQLRSWRAPGRASALAG